MNTSTYAERVQDMGPLEAPFSLKNWRRGIFRFLLYKKGIFLCSKSVFPRGRAFLA